MGIGGVEEREGLTIYITGHLVAEVRGRSAYHLAIEYNGRTLSAGPEAGMNLGLLVLVPELNRPSDRPRNNITFGIVTPPEGVSNREYFDILVNATLRCCNNADYDAFPELSSNGSGYNSNSFVSGIVSNTGGTINLQVNKNTPGFDTPLPSRFFE